LITGALIFSVFLLFCITWWWPVLAGTCCSQITCTLQTFAVV